MLTLAVELPAQLGHRPVPLVMHGVLLNAAAHSQRQLHHRTPADLNVKANPGVGLTGGAARQPAPHHQHRTAPPQHRTAPDDTARTAPHQHPQHQWAAQLVPPTKSVVDGSSEPGRVPTRALHMRL